MSMINRPNGATRNRKRLGRGPGSGNGTTAGKGTKGQNARAGGGVRPGFEGGQMPLYRRIARRGFSNHPFKERYAVVSLTSLDASFDDNAEVSIETLRAAGLVGSSEEHVKVLANGEVTKKLMLSGVKVSSSARARIEAAGGSVAPVVDPTEPVRSRKRRKRATARRAGSAASGPASADTREGDE